MRILVKAVKLSPDVLFLTHILQLSLAFSLLKNKRNNMSLCIIGNNML